MNLPTFACTPQRARISVAQCVKLFAIGKKPSGPDERMRRAHCIGCAVGDAHTRGELPTRWPNGAALERGTTTPSGAAAALAAAPPRDEDHMAAKAGGGRTIEHDGKKLTIEGWARELGITATAVRARIGRGWTELEAVSTPQGAQPPRLAAAASSKVAPPRSSQKPADARKKPAARSSAEARSIVTSADVVAIARALDPVELLTRLGYGAELIGTTPAGRLVLVRAGAE